MKPAESPIATQFFPEGLTITWREFDQARRGFFETLRIAGSPQVAIKGLFNGCLVCVRRREDRTNAPAVLQANIPEPSGVVSRCTSSGCD